MYYLSISGMLSILAC